MADVHSKEQRSYNMSRIKGKNTKPEMLVRKFLHANGFRYKLHDKKLPGKPDIVLPKYKLVICVHGCFWHQHIECKDGHVPKSRLNYWKPKLQRNVQRHFEHEKELTSQGWDILVVWECEIKSDLNYVMKI